MADAQSQVDIVRIPLGSPDAMIVAGGGRQVFVVADPECPDETVAALEMAGHAFARGERLRHWAPTEDIALADLASLIPTQLPGVMRQELGLQH